MPNLSALEPLTTKATALAGLILVSPRTTNGYQPENPPNADGTANEGQRPPTFVFNYEGTQAGHLESDITDHFVEDNITVEDQIALKPEIYTTNGFIGELNDVVPEFLKPIKYIANKLVSIPGYAPQLSVTAELAYTNAFFLYQVGRTTVNAAVSAWSSITGSDGLNVIGSEGLGTQFNFATGEVTGSQNKQQTAFQQLYGYWRARALFTIQTPWAVFDNMAILRIRAIQEAESRTVTDFEVTFKKIRVATTQRGLGGLGLLDLFQGRSRSQASPVTNLGTSSPVPSQSLGSGLSSMGVA